MENRKRRAGGRTRYRVAFTLIELLVVIAIIAILAAILFPVFAQAREKARQTACLSNMKQIGTAMMMYVQDYDESFPHHWAAAKATADAAGSRNYSYNSGQAWPLMIYAYVKNYQVFDCPTSPDKVYDRDPRGLTSGGVPGVSGSGYDGNYTINYDGITYGTGMSMAGLNAPASIFMIVDGGDIAAVWGNDNYNNLLEDLDLDMNCTSNSWRGGYTKEAALRHMKRANVTFADGHAKNISWTELLTRNADGAAPWNIRNWSDCSPNCPPPVAGPGKCFDPDKLP